jgi:hypothetical protein
MKVEVFKEDDHWVAVPVGLPGSMSGDTMAELFAEVECHKHFCADIPEDHPLPVEYVAGEPEVADQLRAAHEALLALPPRLWPRVVEWDSDNNRPVDTAYTTPYLNLEHFPFTY